MNLVGRLRAAKKAEAKAAATAPARFRRITKRTKVTAPCLLTKDDDVFWSTRLCYIDEAATEWKDKYTHWLPIQWPEVRG